ncbi:MAG TPA: hypothetical protein PLL67_01135, partial [Gammaproteobacteria bacterium]|nr:hypothetical protein [Gammaproteobacteria bacterium]
MFSSLLRAAAVSVSFFQPSRASMVYPTFTLNNIDGITGYQIDGTGQSGTVVVNLGNITGTGRDAIGVGAPFAGPDGEFYALYNMTNPLVNFALLDGNN